MNKVLKMWDDGEKPGRGDLPPPPPPPPVSDDPWAECPFSPLGSGGGRYWFIASDGNLVDMPATTLAQWSKLLELCGGGHAWFKENYPAFDRDGLPLDWFNVRQAVGGIMRRCAELPLFDAEIERRRYGLWKVPGGYALHLGDRVEWRGESRRAGFVADNRLWLRLSPRAGHAEPASAALGQELRAWLARWNWADPHAPDILLGLIVAGWLAGALAWRPHGFIVGEGGTGKSTLLRDVVAALCSLTRYFNDYTEPGVRQLLSESATSIILDEAEATRETEARMLRVLEMLRRASSGSGVQSVKGGADHAAHVFTMAGQAIMGAIFAPPMEPQDASRFTVLDLLPLEAVGDGVADPASQAAAFAAEHGPALWGRALGDIARIHRLIAVLRRRIIARGYSPRLADQLGTIAACRWAMVRDAADDPASADVEDGPDEPLVIVEHLFVDDADRVMDSAGNQALGRLQSSALDMVGDKRTLAQVLNRLRWISKFLATHNGDATWAEECRLRSEEFGKLDALLQGHGVRWGRCERARRDAAPQAPLGLFVSASPHPRLERAFAETAWTGKRWAAALSRLPGALGGRALGPQWIDHVKCRCVWVPAAHFAEPEEGW